MNVRKQAVEIKSRSFFVFSPLQVIQETCDLPKLGPQSNTQKKYLMFLLISSSAALLSQVIKIFPEWQNKNT